MLMTSAIHQLGKVWSVDKYLIGKLTDKLALLCRSISLSKKQWFVIFVLFVFFVSEGRNHKHNLLKIGWEVNQVYERDVENSLKYCMLLYVSSRLVCDLKLSCRQWPSNMVLWVRSVFCPDTSLIVLIISFWYNCCLIYNQIVN